MNIQENLKEIREKIRIAAVNANRNPEEIKLIAVSKTKPMSAILEAIDEGQMDFGENRPQEIVEKFPHASNVNWHLIGQLQKNKVRHVIDKATLIHSVDSISLADEIQKRAEKIDKIQDILIQVNISGESTKSGVSPEYAIQLCKQISNYSNIRIKGLMTISVRGMTYEENFELFSQLKKLAEQIARENIPNVSMEELSMGMTHDFDAAIAAGATLIRIGTAIFGERDYS